MHFSESDYQRNSFKKLHQIRVITKLPNTEQSSKGKVKTHKSINKKKRKSPFIHIWTPCLRRSRATIPKINANLYSVPRIIVLKVLKDRSTRHKSFPREKINCLQIDDKDYNNGSNHIITVLQCGKRPLANSPKASGNFGWRVQSTLYSPVWRVTVVRRVGT